MKTILVPKMLSVSLGTTVDWSTGAGDPLTPLSVLDADTTLPQEYIDANVTKAVWACVGVVQDSGNVGGIFELRPIA